MAIARQMAVATENSGLYETLRQKAEELRKNTLELEKANKAKDEFLSTMSHELRTPLNVVIGYAAMLKDGMAGNINPEQEKALGKILTRANDQLEMINRMLQATQIGVGELRVTKQVVNLNELLAGVRSITIIQPVRRSGFTGSIPPTFPSLGPTATKSNIFFRTL